jgi:hypothetical protein
MPSSSARKPYTTGKAFSIDELKKKSTRTLEPSPRDIGLAKAIREAAAAPESDVIPFYIAETDKIATVKLAARRIAERLELSVSIGSHRAYPGTVLLSRGKLSNRGNRRR